MLGLAVRMQSIEPMGMAHAFSSMIMRRLAHTRGDQEAGIGQEVGRGFKPKALPLATNFFT